MLLGQGVADFLAGAFEIAHVHGAVRLGGRADAEEDHLGILHRVFHVVGELELARGVVFLHQFVKARLEDRTMAVQEGLKLFGVLLHAANGMTDGSPGTFR